MTQEILINVEEMENLVAPSFMCSHGIMHVDGVCGHGDTIE